MAQIPDFTALGQTPVPTPSYRRPLIDESARGVDESVAGLGDTLTKVGGALHQKAQADAATWASNQLTDFRVQTQQAMESAQANAPDDAHGFTPGVLADFDKRAATLSGVAQDNPLAAQFLEKAMPNLRAQVTENAMRWESQQRVAYRGQSVVDNTTKLTALVEADPSQRLGIGGQLMAQIDAAGLEPKERGKLKEHVIQNLSVAAANGLSRLDPRGTLQALNDPENAPPDFKPVVGGLSDAQRETVRQKANEELTKPIYTQLENNDFAGAQKNLYAQRDLMDPKTVYQMQNIIDAKSKEKDNENRQDIADRYQDSLAAAQYAIPNAVTVTRAEMDVLHPKDGARYWDALQGVVEAGAKAQQYNQMTPEQMAADRDASYPTSGGPETALKIKAYEIRANAMDQSLKARNSDPAQFAMDSGLGWKPLDLNKPDDALAQLKARANSQGQVSEQTGVNTPLLSKPETRQLTGWLDNQKPSDRLQTLTSLRTSMPNDQAYGALMKQLAPDSPITAVAGSMLDKPSGAQAPWFDSKFATDPIVPQRMLEGQDILRAKDEKGITSKFPMPGDKDLQTAFQEAVGGAHSDLFRGRPQTLETTYAGYKAFYAAEASHRGVTNGVIDPGIASLAAHSVVGHADTYGSTNLVVPSGMDPTKFEGAVEAATQSALKAAGYDDKDVQALRGHGLRELGETLGTGRYVIIDGNGDPLTSRGSTGLNTSRYALPANDPAANSANWDKRADGSDKGQGFLGLLKRPDGRVSSEISIGVEVNGKEMEVPTMVPTLSQKELDYLMTNPVGKGHPMPPAIVQKATDYARQRIVEGKSPFAGPGEQVAPGRPGSSVVIDLNKAQRASVFNADAAQPASVTAATEPEGP